MKWILSILGVVFSILILAIIASYVVANNGFPDYLAKMFPEQLTYEDRYDASGTLVAPFQDPSQKTEFVVETKGGQVTLPHSEFSVDSDVNTDLSKAHRLNAHVAAWLTEVTTEALSLTGDDYEGHLDMLSSYLDANALASYKSFMEKSRILDTVQSHSLQLTAFVKDTPELRNTGVIAGRYRWLYDVQVMLSFLPQGITSYEDVDVVNENIRLRVQIGRVAADPTDTEAQGIMIESWDVKKVTEEQ